MQSDANPNQNPGEKKSRFWQFSLREIVLAMTAIAAITAVLISNSPRQTSAMAQQFDPEAILAQILKDENLKGSVFLPSQSASSSSSRISKDFQVRLDGVSIEDAKTKVMLAFREHIRTSIDQHGCEINGRSSGGSRAVGKRWTDLSNFGYEYEGKRIRGHVRVFTSCGAEGTPSLFIFLDEY